MDMFLEIEKEKVELPSFAALTKNLKQYKFNFYQGFAIFVFLILFIIGIILGNMFPACRSNVSLYSSTCTATFNFSLMLTVWFGGFILCVFIFAIGHIIHLLTDISNSLRNSK